LKISEHIENHRKLQGRTKVWLAERLGMTKQNLQYKLTNNTITGYELVRIGELLDINLNDLKYNIKKEENI
jgi:DNA-binding Xre family transcriptional regulator